MSVRAKKYLGQHFLKDENIARKIAEVLSYKGYSFLLEIGPGMGVLTKYLLQKDIDTYVIEIDQESVQYLKVHYPILKDKILSEDFLKWQPQELFQNNQFAIVGNFPYNISSQILFKTIELRSKIPEFGGMFQKEVAQRICAVPGSKIYGILSVLTQAFYDA
ncbi:MAG: rRNA adenine N-6-methyltransferase family protein, partial [Bacteroidota bacterium]